MQNIKTAAHLFNIFMYNVNDAGQLNDNGLGMISFTFGEVPQEDRADVFIKFLSLLEASGLNYDKQQFAF